MRNASLVLAGALVVGVLSVVAAFALASPATGDRDGTGRVDLQDQPNPSVQLDLSDVERAIEDVADVKRTSQSESRVAENLKQTVGESVRWELPTNAYVEAVVFRDARTARASAQEVARIGGKGTTVIQVDNVLTLLPDALVDGDQKAVGAELLKLRTEPASQANRV